MSTSKPEIILFPEKTSRCLESTPSKVIIHSSFPNGKGATDKPYITVPLPARITLK
jgi:hypothetical protein